MTYKLFNIVTARYEGESNQWYTKGETYVLLVTSSSDFPIVVRQYEDSTSMELKYSHLNNMLGDWNNIVDTMGTWGEEV